tara:strand:- start:577 stop:1254 length:678 start_codon:yes stop_codon:yes gene_type:complete
MIHYHGTPISPIPALLELAGRHFCVSHMSPQDVARCHQIGQSVMLDNGAFSKWKSGKATDWAKFYDWCDRWLDYPTTWAVIPDVIDAGSQEQDALIREWPHGKKGAPVWHMDEPIHRLLSLCDDWPRVCVGSTAEYACVMSSAWCFRMDEAWNAVSQQFNRLPILHMLRGMQLSGKHWPFASVDSTDIAQNHNRKQNTPRLMADRWDAMQTPCRWKLKEIQGELI